MTKSSILNIQAVPSNWRKRKPQVSLFGLPYQPLHHCCISLRLWLVVSPLPYRLPSLCQASIKHQPMEVMEVQRIPQRRLSSKVLCISRLHIIQRFAMHHQLTLRIDQLAQHPNVKLLCKDLWSYGWRRRRRRRRRKQVCADDLTNQILSSSGPFIPGSHMQIGNVYTIRNSLQIWRACQIWPFFPRCNFHSTWQKASQRLD